MRPWRAGPLARAFRAARAAGAAPLLVVALNVATPAAAADADVDARSDPYVFSPAEITVLVGDTVTWTMRAGDPHTVTSGTYSPTTGNHPDGRFDSGIRSVGETYAVTFETAGQYPYICLLHADSGMVGRVTVLASASAPPTAKPSATPKSTPKATPRPTPRATAAPTPAPTPPPTPAPTLAASPTVAASSSASPSDDPGASAGASGSATAGAVVPGSARPAAEPMPATGGEAGGLGPLAAGLVFVLAIVGGALAARSLVLRRGRR